MSVSQVVECIEHLDFIIDGSAEDLLRSVVPAALKADSLSLEDVIKVIDPDSQWIHIYPTFPYYLTWYVPAICYFISSLWAATLP